MEQINVGGITARCSRTDPPDTVSWSTVSPLSSANGLVTVCTHPLYQTLDLILISIGVVSYFLSGVLSTAGVSDTDTQNKLFVAMNAVQVIFAGVGSCFVDKLGRRKMLIWVNLGCAICWIGVTAGSGVQASTQSKASSVATITMIYLFQVVYSFGWTPLQALYPVEVLSQEMRAKGMAFSTLFVNCGTLVNQFGFPVALANIKWKTYIVFLVWCVIQAGIIYLLMPETKNRTVSSPNFSSLLFHS